MRIKLIFLLTLLCIFISGCAVKPPIALTPIDLNPKITSGEYTNKIDNFLLIFDASSSMFDSPFSLYGSNEIKFYQAKILAKHLNETIPDISLQAGLRTFGPPDFPVMEDEELLHGMAPYNSAEFAQALSLIKSTGGTTPLAESIVLAINDLKKTSGEIALIIISDAQNVQLDAVEAATELKEKYGNKICIYTILIGAAPEWTAPETEGLYEIMEQISNAGECGFPSEYDDLTSSDHMAEFVEKVFLTKVLDADGDGVIDSLDKCPDTPKRVSMNAEGCPPIIEPVKPKIDPPAVVVSKPAPAPQDSDGDGVIDSLDKCPGTPLGIEVDRKGCPVPINEKVTIELNIEFDFDKYNIKQNNHQKLKEFAEFMKSYPGLSVTLEGHTDNWGKERYNVKLSKQRAESVKNYLVENFNINRQRLTTTGFGFSRPIASNKTLQGRKRNRRVYAIITAMKGQ